MRPVFVGESNPYGNAEHFDLWPSPANSAGARLCRNICGLSDSSYIALRRINLCRGAWSLKEANKVAMRLLRGAAEGEAFVLLGSKVCSAFRAPFLPFTDWETTVNERKGPIVLVLPHPSGRNRLWNEAGAAGRARKLLREQFPDIPWGERDAAS